MSLIKNIFVKNKETGDYLKPKPDGSLDVNLQDQTTDPILEKFSQVIASTTLSQEALRDTYQVEVASATDITLLTQLILFSPIVNAFISVNVVAIDGTTIDIDQPLDNTFPAGSSVDIANTNMAVNGSGTPVVFGLRGTSGDPVTGLVVDITRIMFKCFTDDPVDLELFGDLPKLNRGLLLRKRNGNYKNVFNVKDNGEIAGIAFNYSPYSALKPNEGVDGFVARLTFAGQNKLGVAVRLPAGEDLEVHIQDDLTGLDLLEISAEGHVVEDGN